MESSIDAVVVRYDEECDEFVYSDGRRVGPRHPLYKEAYRHNQQAEKKARLDALDRILNELDALDFKWRDQIMALLNERYK